MKINENELRENIVTDNNQKDKEKNKIFKINLKEDKKERLIKIIERDTKFLKEVDSQFLVFERNIDRASLNLEEKNEISSKSKVTTKNIKKYIYLNQIKMEKILQELLEKVISLIQKREEYF